MNSATDDLRGADRLRARWKSRQAALGLWAAIPASITAEMAGAVGYDDVCIDLQHRLSDERTMDSMLQAAAAGGTTPLVRPAWNEPGSMLTCELSAARS